MEKHEIENALTVIQECCKEAEECRDCPFDDGSNGCALGDTIPKDWKIKVKDTVKVTFVDRR